MKRLFYIIVLFLIATFFTTTISASPIKNGDPHYNKAGFFDIHVCNWPNRPLFFMLIFSSYEYNNIQSVDIYSAQEKLIKTMTLDKYRIVIQKDKPEKHAFINQLDITDNFTNGWYSAKITMKDGTSYTAKDYVIINEIPIVDQIMPIADAESIAIPKQLKWKPVEGATYYRVFIRDMWNDGKLIFKSDMLSKPSLDIADGVLQADGWYSWMIHARDTNEHVLLGDFNHGSLSPEYKFSTAP